MSFTNDMHLRTRPETQKRFGARTAHKERLVRRGRAMVQTCALVGLYLCMTACATPTTSPMLFKTAGLSDERWDNARKECDYEAEKAVASAGPKTPVEYKRRRLFVMCVELKGAKYVGYASVPVEQWNAIRKLCTDEFEAAIAGLPESPRRGELRDQRKFACLKRNGIALQDGVP